MAEENNLALSRGSVAFTTTPTPRLVFNSPNRPENRDLVLFGDAVKNLIHFLPQAFAVAGLISAEDQLSNRENIFSEVLSCYTAQTLQMRNSLSVSTYNGHISIWIKRFFFATDTQSWHACKGGFQITPHDLEANIMTFLTKHIDILKPKKTTM